LQAEHELLTESSARDKLMQEMEYVCVFLLHLELTLANIW